MKKRVNNDLKQTLTINQGGSAEDFTLATNIVLEAYIPNTSYKVEMPFRRVNNIFYVYAPANTLKIGIYTYVLSYNKPDTDFESGLGTLSIDFKDAFEIVRHTEDEDEAGQHLTGIVSSALDGATFTPVVTDVSGDLTLSWTNDREKTNPTPVILNEGVPEAVLAANTAASTANTAADSADDATELANAAAALANEKAGYADEKGDYAKEQGDYAKDQGDYAKEQGDYAKGVGDSYAATLNAKESLSNKVTSLSASSTDTQYPSAKLTYDQLALQEKIADLKLIQPAVQFYKRVVADGGTIVDKSLLAKFYTEMNQSLANTHALYFFQLGIKERVSGINRFCNKAYDFSPNNNDAIQATEATQPYVGGYIAPNEFRCLKYLQGQTQTGEITIPTKSYLATDSWTLFLVLKANKRGTTRILTGANSYIDITATTIVLHNGTSATLTGTHTYDVGKIAQIEFQYSNGTGLIKVNNVPLATTVISTTMSITRLAYSSTNPFDGSIYYYHLENIRISEADSQKRYNFLRSLIAEIEGINIGNQNWITSNVEQTVAGNGGVIPEVQLATTPATEYISGGDFEAGLIGTLTLEGAAGTWAINETSPISGTKDGKLIITTGNAVRPFIRFAKLTLPTNKVYIFSFSYKVNSGTVIIRSIDFQGAQIFYTETLTGTGVFTKQIYTTGTSGAPSINFGGSGVSEVQIDNISIKEAGWADLTTPARCYYDNSITNGAVYNKLFNGYAVALLKNYPPSGYRVATYADWLQLSTFAGGNTISGKKIKKDGLIYWLTTNSGTNELGLSVIGLGKRNVDGTFANIGTEANFWTADGYLVTIANNADTISFASGADLKTGAGVLLIRTSPTVPQRGVIRASSTANIASTPLSIPIPFGCQVESIRIRNKQAATNLTSISATHNNTAGASLGTLITGKTVNAATSSIFVATLLDMASQETDGTVRILATGNGNEGCDIEVTYKTMAL